jgi:hypothetical protein
MHMFDPVIAQLESQLAALKSSRLTAPQPRSFVTTDAELRDLIRQELDARLGVTPAPAPPSSQGIPQQMLAALGVQATAVVQQAYSPEQMTWIKSHASEGAPGLSQFLQSGAVKTLLQTAFNTYQSFLAGDVK